MRTALIAAAAACAAADRCVSPGQCVPPSATYSVALPMGPRKQWGNSGGYCGSASVQMNALMFGNYFSQDQVRKATTHGEGHGNIRDGFEILPTNIEEAMTGLALSFDAFDYTQPKPQSDAYKKWLKAHLVKRHPVVWFVMCRGDGAQVPYPGSNPNDGRFSHIEPVWGIFSNKSLDDPTAYPDDWLVHGSDWDNNGYYRPFHSLVDTPAMEGNCRHAGRYPGVNEAYPCIYGDVDYGYAVTGNVDPKGLTVPAYLSVDNDEEPNVSAGARPEEVHGTLHITTQAGARYVIYRYDGKENVPRDSNFDNGHAIKTPFTATGTSFEFKDPKTFLSNTAVFYRVTRTQ